MLFVGFYSYETKSRIWCFFFIYFSLFFFFFCPFIDRMARLGKINTFSLFFCLSINTKRIQRKQKKLWEKEEDKEKEYSRFSSFCLTAINFDQGRHLSTYQIREKQISRQKKHLNNISPFTDYNFHPITCDFRSVCENIWYNCLF